MVLRIVFYRANKGCLFGWRETLIMSDFLEGTENVRAVFAEDVNAIPLCM